MAKEIAKLGATDKDLARIFGVSDATIDNWKARHPDFLGSLKDGKEEADNRVERSLYTRAVGYSYEAVKIFMPAGRSKPVYAPYTEHVPPACSSLRVVHGGVRHARSEGREGVVGGVGALVTEGKQPAGKPCNMLSSRRSRINLFAKREEHHACSR
jgi:hypothetical protein